MIEPTSEHTHAEENYPLWLLAPFRVCKKRLEQEDIYLHLALQGFEIITKMPQLYKALAVEDNLQAMCQAAERVAHEDREGFPVLFAHAAVGVWTAVEVLSNDFALAWLRNHRQAWQADGVASIAMPIGDYQRLNEEERSRFVLRELSRTKKVDLRDGLGKLTALLDEFSLKPKTGANVRRALHELGQVRNVLVHCAGCADGKFINECPWFETKLGGRIRVSHCLYGWYKAAATCFLERLLQRAVETLGFIGCTCRGVDEISERPSDVLRHACGSSS